NSFALFFAIVSYFSFAIRSEGVQLNDIRNQPASAAILFNSASRRSKFSSFFSGANLLMVAHSLAEWKIIRNVILVLLPGSLSNVTTTWKIGFESRSHARRLGLSIFINTHSFE